MEAPKMDEQNSTEKGYIIRMPLKTHTDLKLSASVMNKNMQELVLEAIEDKLEKLKLSNERIAYILKENKSHKPVNEKTDN